MSPVRIDLYSWGPVTTGEFLLDLGAGDYWEFLLDLGAGDYWEFLLDLGAGEGSLGVPVVVAGHVFGVQQTVGFCF